MKPQKQTQTQQSSAQSSANLAREILGGQKERKTRTVLTPEQKVQQLERQLQLAKEKAATSEVEAHPSLKFLSEFAERLKEAKIQTSRDLATEGNYTLAYREPMAELRLELVRLQKRNALAMSANFKRIEKNIAEFSAAAIQTLKNGGEVNAETFNPYNGVESIEEITNAIEDCENRIRELQKAHGYKVNKTQNPA